MAWGGSTVRFCGVIFARSACQEWLSALASPELRAIISVAHFEPGAGWWQLSTTELGDYKSWPQLFVEMVATVSHPGIEQISGCPLRQLSRNRRDDPHPD